MGRTKVQDTSTPTRRKTRVLKHPAQVVVVAFGATIAIGTLLLTLPVAREGAGSAPLITALFTATSATCVTGLSTVDTPNYWTTFGELVIMGLIQVGGFGIMTLASLLALFVTKRMGLTTRLTAAAETKSVGPGEVRSVLFGVFKITVAVEGTIALLLAARFFLAHDMGLGTSAYRGLFHAVSSFNNAGFALFSDNMTSFRTDPFIELPIAVSIIIGGLGFPVIMELLRRTRPHRWSLHTKFTVLMTAILLVGATIFLTFNEWSNPGTIGGLSPGNKVLNGFFHAVQPRTAGFNAWDYSQVNDGTLLGTIVLMFIGGGSASTAGGLKVTTFLLLLFAIIAEVRGEPDVNAFDRRIDPRSIRQAITVALLGLAAIIGATVVIIELNGLPLTDVLFEATSAFGTVGLSTGITAQLNIPAQLVIISLMFLGRLGPATLVSALVLRERQRHYRLPEGRPLIG